MIPPPKISKCLWRAEEQPVVKYCSQFSCTSFFLIKSFSSVDKLTRLEKPLELPHVWVGQVPTHNYPHTTTFKRPLLRLYKVKHSEFRKWQTQVCALLVWPRFVSTLQYPIKPSVPGQKGSSGCPAGVWKCPTSCAWPQIIWSFLKRCIIITLKVELKKWHHSIIGNVCVCQDCTPYVPRVDTRPWPKHLMQ